MEVKSIGGMAGYRDLERPEKKVPNISLQEQKQVAQPNPAVNENGQANKQNDSFNQLKSAIDMANVKLRFTKTRCEFEYYEDISRVAIKVIDRETDEVIREIPPEETLELVQKLWELAGILVDEKR